MGSTRGASAVALFRLTGRAERAVAARSPVTVRAARLTVPVFDPLMMRPPEAAAAALARGASPTASAEAVQVLRTEWAELVETVERAIAAVARFTGMETSQAQGTLRAPTIGGRRVGAGTAPAVRALPTSAITVTPATRSVAAPGSVVSSTRVTRVSRTSAPVFHINGADPRATAAEAVRLMQQAERDRRDGDHPVEDDDDDAPARGASQPRVAHRFGG